MYDMYDVVALFENHAMTVALIGILAMAIILLLTLRRRRVAAKQDAARRELDDLRAM